MGREIPGSVANKEDFHPMVGIRKIGQYVKGKILVIGATAKKNPVLTLELIDLTGTTSTSPEKGKYIEVEVGVGDKVQFIGNLTDLKDKLPKLNIGEIVTITYDHDVPSGKGNPKKIFKVEVDE